MAAMMMCGCAIVLPVFTHRVSRFACLKNNQRLNHMTSQNNWNLTEKVAIVTGANTGIGLETSRMLLNAGCIVVMACRDLSKGEMSRVKLCQDVHDGERRCFVMQLDLASFRSIKLFASQVEKRFNLIHLLVNNAGVICSKRTLTEDGFEQHFGVNHLGHFHLTRLVLPKLIQSAPSRIINVSSKAHEYAPINFDDLQLENNWSPLKAYGRSKTANILFTVHLALLLEGTGVTTCCLHPGIVETNLGREMERSCFMCCFKCVMALMRKKMLDPSTGAQTTIFCCTEGSVSDGHSGLYYSDSKVHKAKKHATDAANAERLWDISSRLCDLPSSIL